MSTYAHIPHPRIEARRKARPVSRADSHVGFNGRLAAWMTQRVGTMWSVYVVTAFVLAWMILAQLGPLGFDRYPFPFMLFLGNVVQLLLIFVILVGQQVLGATTERRAAETFEDAEAILHEVRQLHDHLLAQDKILSRGIELCAAKTETWTEDETIEEPASVPRSQIGLNGRIADYLTRGVGTMWAFYVAAAFQVIWIGLAATGILTFDPYPFPFLLFLSSLVQLILMFVIMVGQEVQGASGDQRAAQTYEDAEAVIRQCFRLQKHLTAQDTILVSIVDSLEQERASA